MSDSMRNRLFSDSFRRNLQGYNAIEVFRAHAEQSPTQHPLSLIQYLDMKTYLPGDILTKVDRASMAHALEVRVPLLDHKLVEWISSIPPQYKLHGQEGKYIFKKAMEPYLSKDILYRRKMGFSIPIAEWFRGPLKNTLSSAVMSATMADTGMFDMKFLSTLLEQHQSGLRDHSASLWSLLMYESFLRQNSGLKI